MDCRRDGKYKKEEKIAEKKIRKEKSAIENREEPGYLSYF